MFGPPLCVCEGGYGAFILVPPKKTWGILDAGIAVQSYTGIQMWMSWTMGLQSIAQTKRHGIKVKQGRQQRKGSDHAAQACSTQSQAVFNQRYHSIATSHQALFNRQPHFFATSLSNGKPPPQFMPSHRLAPPISWQTPAPVDSKSATWPLPSHALHPPPLRKELDEMGGPFPPTTKMADAREASGAPEDTYQPTLGMVLYKLCAQRVHGAGTKRSMPPLQAFHSSKKALTAKIELQQRYK